MRELLIWKYVSHDDPLCDADVIIGMAFGANRKGRGDSPGLSNETLAKVIADLWRRKPLPVIVQREIAEAINRHNLPIKPEYVISEAPNQFHITSYEVLERAWKYSRKRGWKTAVIVAHQAHILRCAWVAKRLGFQVRLPDVGSVPYEPSSKQWWTRNKVLFFFWELYARIGWKMKDYL